MSTPTQKPAANREIKIFPDVNAIAKRAAELIVESAATAVAQNGRFTISLAGGSTPKTLYALLAAEPHGSKMPWDKTYLFFGDERHVPPDDPDSNYRMANESLISKLSLKPDQIHRIHCENPVEKAAQDYEQDLRTFFKLAPGQLPRFDVILIGMGDEGHMLSLFPGTKALQDNGRLVLPNWVGKLYTERVTITAPVANNSALAIFMVTKADKALALKGVLEGPYEPEQLPSQLLRPTNGKVVWLVDTTAASKLASGTAQTA
jgi:6-phosphogluconolactonase